MKLFIYLLFMPIKLLIVLLGVAVFPMHTTIQWITDPYGDSWDETAVKYIKGMVNLLRFEGDE